MSVEAVKWALYEAPILLTDKGKPDTTARQVLAVLAEHAGPDGADAFPSSLKITFATGLDERTVQRALVRLERGGQVARDGVSKHGTTRWKLALSVTRPESEWPQMQAEADRARRAESDARSARRRKARETKTDTDLSGTQNPGQPGRRVPDIETGADLSGTQSAGCPGRSAPRTTRATTSTTTSTEGKFRHPLRLPFGRIAFGAACRRSAEELHRGEARRPCRHRRADRPGRSVRSEATRVPSTRHGHEPLARLRHH